MSNNQGCQCRICTRNKRLAKIARRRKLSKSDQKFLFDILEELNNTEFDLESKELTLSQIQDSGCLDVNNFRKFIRQGERKEKEVLNQLWDDLFAAKKARDGNKTNLLSTLIAEIQAIGKNDGNRQATEAEAIAVVKKFLKNVEITFQALQDKSPDSQHLEGLQAEKELLKSYLPKQLDETELKEVIGGFIGELEDVSKGSMGVIMGKLKSQYSGQYDGKMASTLVREMLS